MTEVSSIMAKICNINSWIENDPPPPPFGTFPKIHPFWKGKASLSIGIAFKLVCILINLPIKAVSMYWAELNPGVRLYHLIMVSFDLIWKLLVASVENDFDEQRLKDISGPHNSSGKELLAELTLLSYAKQAQWIRANWGKTCPNIEAEAARACWACRQVSRFLNS